MLPARVWRWLRTVRHFPVSALVQRLRLKIARKCYLPPAAPSDLALHWRRMQDEAPWMLPASFEAWRLEADGSAAEAMAGLADLLLEAGEGVILNETFRLADTTDGLRELLATKSPLWRENYNYLEFLLPLAGQIHHSPAAESLLIRQVSLFWSLEPAERNWSVYGVCRRLLVFLRLLPVMTALPEAFQDAFWMEFYRDARYVARFPEWDVQGNHLIKNLTAWTAVVLVLEKLPSTRRWAEREWRKLAALLPDVFERQLLADGFHAERTPMYHAWVLQDLLEVLHRLGREKPDYPQAALRSVAMRMTNTWQRLLHVSGQPPLFGDSALTQSPDPEMLLRYAELVLGEFLEPLPTAGMDYWPQAGFAIFRLARVRASLVLDCGDFCPKALPAHSHCDLGSFEVHVDDRAIVVDSGVGEYAASLVRDYFRGTAAHNTVWVPGEEQAEIWGSFRVAEYPRVQPATVERDSSGARITLCYDSHNVQYEHQRSLYEVNGDFWVVQDWVRHLGAERTCFSLLHVHPDCPIHYEQEAFRLGDHMLVLPFGERKVEWSNQSPWRKNLNLYAPGFNLARPGQLIAVTPRLGDCFGWVLVPYGPQAEPPRIERHGECVDLILSPDRAYRLGWESDGLHVAFRAPAS